MSKKRTQIGREHDGFNYHMTLVTLGGGNFAVHMPLPSAFGATNRDAECEQLISGAAYARDTQP